jgi:MFS family permease
VKRQGPTLELDRNRMKTSSVIFFYIFIVLCTFSRGLILLSIPWHFTSESQGSSLANFYFSATFVSFFLAYPIGTILDMYNRKNILLIFSSFFTLILFTCYITGSNEESFIIIFILCFCGEMLFNLAIYSIIKDSFLPKKYLFHLTFFDLLAQGAAMLAAILGVFLLEGAEERFDIYGIIMDIRIGQISIDQIILISGSTFLISSLFLYFIKYEKRNNLKNIKSYQLYLSDGLINTFSNKKRLLILILCCTPAICLITERSSLSPFYIANVIEDNGAVFANSETYYVYGSKIVTGFALIITVFFSKRIENFSESLYIICFSIFMIAILFITSYITNNTYTYYYIVFALGLLYTLSRLFQELYFLQNIPNNYIARTFSLTNIFSSTIRMFFISIFTISYFHKDTNIISGYLILSFYALIAAITMAVIIKPKPYFRPQ